MVFPTLINVPGRNTFVECSEIGFQLREELRLKNMRFLQKLLGFRERCGLPDFMSPQHQFVPTHEIQFVKWRERADESRGSRQASFQGQQTDDDGGCHAAPATNEPNTNSASRHVQIQFSSKLMHSIRFFQKRSMYHRGGRLARVITRLIGT